MRLSYRRLNKNESYACTAREAKAYWGREPDDFRIDFGRTRQHCFDRADTAYPDIRGRVVAMATVNFRDQNGVGMLQSPPCFYLSFYVITGPYGGDLKKEFVERCLPAIHDWYLRQRSRPASGLSGVEVFLVELERAGYRTHEYRFH